MTTVDKPNVHAIAIEGIVRRLPGDRQGPVQRPRLSRRVRLVGRQLDQLGAHPRADRLLLHRRGRARRAGAARLLRRADRQFRRRARRLLRQAHGPAGRAADRSPPTRTIFSPARWRAASMSRAASRPTQSPSMDIQVSSNFERLLFEAYGRDAAAVRGADGAPRAIAANSRSRRRRARAHPRRFRRFHASTRRPARAEMTRVYRESGVVIDPHTAVGVGAARRALERDPATPVIALGDRPSGEISRRGRARDRRPPAAAGASRRI